MVKLLITPACSDKAKENFENTVLENKHPTWGMNSRSSWEKLSENDHVFFYVSGKYTYIAKVDSKKEDEEFAEKEWGSRKHSLLISLKDLEKVDISKEVFNKKLGYKESYTPFNSHLVDFNELELDDAEEFLQKLN